MGEGPSVLARRNPRPPQHIPSRGFSIHAPPHRRPEHADRSICSREHDREAPGETPCPRAWRRGPHDPLWVAKNACGLGNNSYLSANRAKVEFWAVFLIMATNSIEFNANEVFGMDRRFPAHALPGLSRRASAVFFPGQSGWQRVEVPI